jgi:hypothetical protein
MMTSMTSGPAEGPTPTSSYSTRRHHVTITVNLKDNHGRWDQVIIEHFPFVH